MKVSAVYTLEGQSGTSCVPGCTQGEKGEVHMALPCPPSHLHAALHVLRLWLLLGMADDGEDVPFLNYTLRQEANPELESFQEHVGYNTVLIYIQVNTKSDSYAHTAILPLKQLCRSPSS